jgi:hypothetical protein
VTLGGEELATHDLKTVFGWVRLEGLYQTRTAYPRLDASIYIRGTVSSATKRPATLRLGLDNWAMVYLNGQQVAMADHADEFQTVKIPVTLNEGENQILIKTNNRMNRDRHFWAIHSAVE